MNKRTSFSGFLGLIVLVGVLAFSAPLTGYATDLENQASSLNNELDTLKTELSQTIAAIEETADEIEQQKQDLSEAEANKQQQYEDMKLRIKYMYENGSYSMLQTIIESDSLASLQTNIEYVRTISEYDHDMLDKYEEAYREVEEKDSALQAKRSELSELQTSLEEDISGVEVALSETNDAILQEQQKAALAAQMARAQELAEAASPSKTNSETVTIETVSTNTTQEKETETPAATTPTKTENTDTKPAQETSGSDMIYTLSQFMRAGVINWSGYKFTYYSQSVLPGTGLKIPGRYVNADGYVCDESGYICLAGSAPMGTVYDTPFGYQGKIYDRGTSGNHLDVYIR